MRPNNKGAILASWNSYFRGGLMAGVALSAVAVADAAWAQTKTFDLPAQPAATGVAAFARQADVQVLISATDANGKRTNAVKGAYSIPQALNLLLGGSGLAAQATGEATWTVVSARPHEAAAPVAAAEPTNVSELTVTGTRIAGTAPVGSQTITLERPALLEAGRGTLTELFATLPQFSSGTGSAREEGRNQTRNPNQGSGLSLRGLGQDATLTLLNGRRLAPSGLGTFVDISQIPLTAIGRVEILADGASAIYGSDAVAGVVNLITRHDFDGVEATARIASGDGFRNYTAGATAGRTWDSGSALLSYEYYERSRLRAEDRDYTGADLRRYGGPDLRTVGGVPGTITAGGITYAIPAGQNGRNLTASQLTAGTTNLNDEIRGTDLIGAKKRHSVFGTLEHHLTPSLSVFADGIVSSTKSTLRIPAAVATLTVPSTNPFFVRLTPTLASETVTYSFLNDLGNATLDAKGRSTQANAGLRYDISRDWKFTATVSRGEDFANQLLHGTPNTAHRALALANPNPDLAFNPFGDGSGNSQTVLANISGFNKSLTKYTVESAAADLTGTAFDLPAGSVRFAFGGEARREEFSQSGVNYQAVLTPVRDPGTGVSRRSLKSAYGEIVAPLVNPDFNIPAVYELKISLAGRFEKYSDFGSSTTPKLGVHWSLTDSFSLRGSWGQSFKAPPLFQLREIVGSNPIFSVLANGSDPTLPGGRSNQIIMSGNSANLTPETSNMWSIGFDWQPAVISGLTLEGTYYSIEYKDRIKDVLFTNVLPQPSLYADRITRNPTAAQVLAIYNSPFFSPTSVKLAPEFINVIVDARARNTSSVEQQGWDLLAKYSRPIGDNTLELSGNLAIVTKFAVAETDTSPTLGLISTFANPLRTQGRASASYGNLVWRLGGAVNYKSSYRNTQVLPAAKVSSWTTFDFQASYRPQLLQGARLTLGIQNVADRRPPAIANVASRYGYDPNQANALGRVISLQLEKTW